MDWRSAGRKVLCVFGMAAVTFGYIPVFKYAITIAPVFEVFLSSFSIPTWLRGYLAYIPMLFVLAMSHELLHALAWWYYGYPAIPIPVLVPPFLGITIGPKPSNAKENAGISLAPLLLTVICYMNYRVTGDTLILGFGLINLFGMGYDFISALAG